MSRTRNHKPFKTTEYASKQSGERGQDLSQHSWLQAKKHISRNKGDSEVIRQQNRQRRHSDQQNLRSLSQDPSQEEKLVLRSSSLRDVYKWNTW